MEFDIEGAFPEIKGSSKIFKGVDLCSEVDRMTKFLLASEIGKAEGSLPAQ
jgi:hypothetical protein